MVGGACGKIGHSPVSDVTDASTVTSMRQFVRGLHNLQPQHYGNVVTIGVFDGVHLGHQAILQHVIKQADRLGLPSLAMIFEPQPHEFFSGEKVPARLMRLGEKIKALFAAGIDRVFCLTFNHALSQLSAEDFIQTILIDALGTRHLVVGDDFRFGYGREGNYTLLQAASQQYQFELTDTTTYVVNRKRVSSTRIRLALQDGCFADAAELLGRAYTISGRVVKGQQLARTLGVPTANVHLHRYRSPLSGVFAVNTALTSGKVVPGVANVGVRPTIGGNSTPILEVHLFNHHEEIYGQNIVVEFKQKIREEQRFDNVEALREQMQHDIASAKNILHYPTSLMLR